MNDSNAEKLFAIIPLVVISVVFVIGIVLMPVKSNKSTTKEIPNRTAEIECVRKAARLANEMDRKYYSDTGPVNAYLDCIEK